MKVYPGEIVGLLGPNGAGKSTLFNIAIGAENEDSGNILIDGKSIKDIPIHLRSKSGLAYLPQTRSLFDNLSVFDNLHGLVQLFEKDQKKAIEKTELLLNNFNLVHLRGLKAAVLSGGESKRVSLARLMISNPKCFNWWTVFFCWSNCNTGNAKIYSSNTVSRSKLHFNWS